MRDAIDYNNPSPLLLLLRNPMYLVIVYEFGFPSYCSLHTFRCSDPSLKTISGHHASNLLIASFCYVLIAALLYCEGGV